MVGVTAMGKTRTRWLVLFIVFSVPFFFGAFIFFFGIHIYMSLAGLHPYPISPYHYGLTRPWSRTPWIPRIGIVVMACSVISGVVAVSAMALAGSFSN